MQREHGVVLGLAEAVAVVEREFVGIDRHAAVARDDGIAVFVKHKHIQCGRVGDIRLAADFGDVLLERVVEDADRGPVVEILARSGMLCRRLDCGQDLRVDGFLLERADGTAVEQYVDRGIMHVFSHASSMAAVPEQWKRIRPMCEHTPRPYWANTGAVSSLYAMVSGCA